MTMRIPSAKRLFAWFVLILSFSILLLAFARHGSAIGFDFDLRYNEVLCILDGIDPSTIRPEGPPHPVYWSGFKRPAPVKTETGIVSPYRRVDIYTPWEYTFFFPLALFPEGVASGIFCGLCLLSLLFIGRTAYRTGLSIRADSSDALICLAFSLLLGKASLACLATKNFSIVFSGLIFLLAKTLPRKSPWLPSVFLALLFSKPHVSFLLCVPMAFRNRWKPFFLAGGICALATIPPAILTRTSPMSLVLALRRYTGFISSTPFLPDPVFSAVASRFGHDAASAASAGIGIALCIVTSLALRHSKDWNTPLAAAVLCSLGWTYKVPYEWCLLSLPLLTVAFSLCQSIDKNVPFQNRIPPLLSLGCLATLPFLTPRHGFANTICMLLPLAYIVWMGRATSCDIEHTRSPQTNHV